MPGTSKAKSPRGYEIEFDEATHTYTTLLDGHFTDTGVIPIASGNRDGKTVVKYTSGTTFVHGFFPKFDEDGSISARVAAKRGLTPEQVKAEWKANCAAACEFGTRVHETAEDVLHGRTQFRNAPRDEKERKVFSAAWSAAKSVLQRMDVVGVEKIVFDVDTQIAGTIDLLARDKADGMVWILDWKGLSVDTPIYTSEGWKTMGTIRDGDIVFDRNGKPTSVIHASRVHHNPCYKIKFDNGDELVADHEHRWMIAFNKNGKNVERVMTTEEISAHIKKHEARRKTYNIPRIINPMPLEPSDCETSSLPIHPYVLGVWLGDGSSSCGVVSNPIRGIFDRIESLGFKVGPVLSKKDKCPMRTVYGLRSRLLALGILGNKRIPDMYMKSGVSERIELLRGFMDADGYFNKTRKQFSTSTTRESQRDFVCELLASLGIKYSVFKIVKHVSGKEIESWDICFKSDFNPFYVRNREIDFVGKHDAHSFRSIVSCEQVPTVPTRCIEVDSPTHTFLVGKQMIVTHNTNKSIDFKNDYPTCNRGLRPISHLHNCNAVQYGLQLELYDWLLRTGGYIPRDARTRHGIFHLTEDGPKFHELPRYENEIRDMMIFHLLTREVL